RRFLTYAAAVAATGATGWSVAQVSGTYGFDVVRVRAGLAGLREPLRIAWLTDLHHGQYVRTASVRAWVDAALAESPDVVLLGGDLVDQRPGADGDETLVAELARLRAPLGVLAVWGNHDRARLRGMASFAAALRAAGIDVLVNRGVAVRDDLHVAGLDDFRVGRPDLEATLADRPAVGATLLLSHNPDVLPTVPLDVGLTLSGHTHGGQVVLPGVGALYTSSQYGDRFLAGWVEGPARGYVSRGLGVSSLPVRINCPAELTVLDLAPVV
ncbi:MAG: metallophosphoesterase, partial [Trueperaceae bacterium]|nr:metallophosphoesterase [Trueperaceae bacterium]